MDKNVGLEAFDHSDITASREEKRIKLIRALQGELARLIRLRGLEARADAAGVFNHG
jgi:flagellar biosynthesis/type III secretory pathway M-ring protein FliF/YscJ